MSELERALLELGRHLEYPLTPDIAGTVRARLAERRPAPRWTRRRALALALVVLAVAAGAVMAVPQARTAVLDWLGIRGVEIEFVESLPEVRVEGELALGERVTLAQARARAPYRVLVPTLEGLPAPDEVYLAGGAGRTRISFVYGSASRVRLLLTQFRGNRAPELVKKVLGPGTKASFVTVDGSPAVWLDGKPHRFLYVDPSGEPREETLRLAGNTLLWQRGELTLRLEGRLSREEALDVARSVR